jgi:hypothetical protein
LAQEDKPFKRVEAVTRIVEAVFTEPEDEGKKKIVSKLNNGGGSADEWEPFWEPPTTTFNV